MKLLFIQQKATVSNLFHLLLDMILIFLELYIILDAKSNQRDQRQMSNNICLKLRDIRMPLEFWLSDKHIDSTILYM